PPPVVEIQAELIFGKAVKSTEGSWYPKRSRVLRARDGHDQQVEAWYHPDAAADAVRSQICEAELEQCLGRVRAIRRTADNPVDIYVLTRTPVPRVRVDRFIRWNAPGRDVFDRIFAEHGVLPL